MNEKLNDLLYLYNVSPKYAGYNYFLRAVELAAENPNRLQHLEKDIYKVIALEYQQDYRSVMKNLRTVRDVFMRNNGAVLLEEMGGGDWCFQNPPTGDMIGIFAYYCRKMGLNS